MGNWSEFGVKVDDVSTTESRLDTSFNEYYDLGGVSQSHDDNGNLTDDGTREMAWDAFNRLRLVSDGVNVLGEYLYDSGNRRARVDVGEGDWIVDFIYDGWKEIQQTEDDNASSHYGDLMRQTIYGPFIDERLCMDIDADNDGSAIEANDDTRYFYLQNTLYSTYAMTDSDANLVEAYEYDPYGKATLLTDGADYDTLVNLSTNDARDVGGLSTLPDTGNFFWFTGRYFDQHSGLQYSRRRYYDPLRARFLGRDPIRFRDGPNAYSYALNRPTYMIDAFGLTCCVIGQIRNPKCMVQVVDYGSTPESKENGEDLVHVARILWILEIVQSADDVGELCAKSTQEIAEAISKILIKVSYTLSKSELAEVASLVAEKCRGWWGGWNLYTNVVYEKCSYKWFNKFGSKWKVKKDGWELYRKQEDAPIYENYTNTHYDTREDAYKDAEAACDRRMENFYEKYADVIVDFSY